jgi:para-nitrobenzyl esterase
MATYWTNFARNGDPNGGGVPVWPNFTGAGERVLHIGDNETAGGVPNEEELQRLDQRYRSLRGAAALAGK